MLAVFFALYFYCFIAGRNEYRKQRREHIKFQRLRLTCMLLVFLDAWWPIQYLLKHDMSQWYKTLVVMMGSSVDIVSPLCIGTICMRIFSCYYRIKCDPVPSRYKMMLVTWFLVCCVVSVLEVLRFAYNDPTFGTIFFYFCIVWFSVDAIMLLILSLFLYQLIRLLWNSYRNVSDSLLAKVLFPFSFHIIAQQKTISVAK